MRPISVLVAIRILLLYVVPDVYHRWLLPFGFLYFYYVYSKHLVYLLALASQPCPIWTVSRDPLFGVPSMSFVLVSCSNFTAWIPLKSPLLSPGFWCFPLIWWFFQDLDYPFVPCYRVFCKFIRRTVFLLQAMFQEVLSFLSVVIILWRRRSNGIFFLAFRWAYFDGCLSSDSVIK